MTVRPVSEAYEASWRTRVRCAWEPRDGMKRLRERVCGAEPVLQTLAWTRGRDFPFARLESRLKCPRYGPLTVIISFDVPTQSNRVRGATSR